MDARPPAAESSVMFSLAMLTREAPTPEARSAADDIANLSAGDVFMPVLAAPAVEEKPKRRSGARWVAAAVGVTLAMAMPVAVYVTRSPVRQPPPTAEARPEPRASTTSIAIAIAAASTIASATPAEHLSSPPAPHARPAPPPASASHATKPPQAPKCCPGETEMECAMRRSVGAVCNQG